MKYSKQETLLEKIMFLKIFIDRSKGYTNIATTMMIGVVTLNSFLNIDSLKGSFVIELMNENLGITYALFIVGGILCLIGVGWMDTKIGARSEEMRNNSLHNPVTVEMLHKIREIHANKTQHKLSTGERVLE